MQTNKKSLRGVGAEITSPPQSPPKISVIVPVYKVEKYLPECIDSILAQTFTDFELILVDDGSPDNSGKICDNYAARDSRIRVFHKQNGGVSSARNLGLDNARGEWIAFVDSDDVVRYAYLEHLLQDATSCSLVVSGWTQYDEKGRVVNTRTFSSSTCSVLDGVIAKGDICCGIASKLFDGNICRINNVRFDCFLSKSEDALFTLRYLEHAKRVILLPYFSDYCYNERGCGGASIRLSYEQHFYLFRERLDAYKKLSACYLNEQLRRKLAWNYSFVFRSLYHPRTRLDFPLRLEAMKESVIFLQESGFSQIHFRYPWKIVMLKHYRVFDYLMRCATWIYCRFF